MQTTHCWKWLILLCLWAGYAQASETTHSTIVQISTIQALLKGVYDG